MLKLELIGNLGADAQVKESDGRKFASCRVAHTDNWKDKDGIRHEQTTWIDVILSSESAIIPYLKKGTMIYVRGTISTRVYSSEKERCMKAGITIRAQEIQLLSSKTTDETKTKEEEKDAPFIG